MTSREVVRVPQRQEELTLSPNRQSQGEPTMKTTTTQQPKTVLGVLLLAALAMTGANAGILHSDPVTGLLPGGDFSLPNFPAPGCDSYVFQDFPGQGQWSHNETSPASDFTRVVTESGGNRHAEMEVQWHDSGRQANVWYTDAGNTGTTAAWTISADMMYTGQEPVAKFFMLKSGGAASANVFSMDFTTTAIAWTAGSQNGTFNSVTGLDSVWRTVSFFYNPVNGLAYGRLGAETVFSTTIATGLTVQTVAFTTMETATTPYANNILSIDNVSAVPEPAALGLLALGALGFLRRRR
jgi:MYXO-CTERM domain-containing protein